MKEAVHTWLTVQLKTLISKGIRNLLQWWTKYIKKQSDYVQKLC
jgi:hypothetical protein